MRKVVALFVLLVVGLLVLAERFATIPTAAASPAPIVANAVSVPLAALDPAPPAVDLPAAPSADAPAKRKSNATTPKRRIVYRCEVHPLQMGTVDTYVRVCDRRDG